ncbi:hypothetical protein TNCT_483881 [Trichonephila clavata]|uniref:Uncharacterized protein n=1 Tax=Trichonephila clavata TaxID=2740835 RepID=A0A8X6FWZ6_TRICU|nr:hypothetical protein TNCT_483881 [Trichonephila clavata]
MIDICVVNKWRAYQVANPDEKLSLSDVRRKIVLLYLSKKSGSTSKRLGPQGNKLMKGAISTDVSLDPGNHSIVPTNTQKRCAYRKKKTAKVYKYNVGVHDKCFVSFYTP